MNSIIIPNEKILDKIYLIRGHKVILDKDLAAFYGVETKVLKQAVRRNIEIFPEHFMFELNKVEFKNLRSQIVTSSLSWGGQRYLPMAFTEHGILQVASLLRSKKAKQISIRIIEIFVEMRNLISSNQDILLRLSKIEKHLPEHDDSIDSVMNYLRQFVKDQNQPRKEIGFKSKNKQR